MAGVFIVIAVLMMSWAFLITDLNRKFKKEIMFKLDSIEFKNNQVGEKIPMLKEDFNKSGCPLIEIKINENSYKMLLDSGANINIFDYNAFKEFEDSTTDKSESSGFLTASDNISNNVFKSNVTFKIKQKKFTESFEVLDMSGAFNAIENRDGVRIHGVLGSMFFQSHKWSLDFEDLVIWTK